MTKQQEQAAELMELAAECGEKDRRIEVLEKVAEDAMFKDEEIDRLTKERDDTLLEWAQESIDLTHKFDRMEESRNTWIVVSVIAAAVAWAGAIATAVAWWG